MSFTMNSGSGGSTLSADTVASEEIQQVKLMEGATGANDGVVSSANPLPVEVISTAAGGCSVSSQISAAAVMSVSAKASAGKLYAVQVHSIASAPAYLRFYNKATAGASTDTPVLRIGIPIAETNADGWNTEITFPEGLAFSLGIAYRCTESILDNDTTVLGASEVLVNVIYK